MLTKEQGHNIDHPFGLAPARESHRIVNVVPKIREKGARMPSEDFWAGVLFASAIFALALALLWATLRDRR